ncbi:alpha-ketoacid dehydrogenase subunit beta [Chloroflexota bacterium]
MRELKYREALSEGLVQAMEADSSVFVMGVGVDDPKGIFGTTLEATRRFGSQRIFDIPLSENTLTGAAIGASLCGLRPVMVHARNEFLLITMDQLINNAAKWRYVSSGSHHVPITVRTIIGRGWGQGVHHSQSLQALFAHTPGLKVVMPATPHDAKGLLIASIKDDSPVIFIEHRRLYETTGPVPEEYFEEPLGKAIVRRRGTDVTIVAMSFMVSEALKAAEILESHNVNAEVIDLRTVCPIDEELIFDSVRLTHRLVVADTAWRSGGIGSEIVARVAQELFQYLEAPPRCIGSPSVPAAPSCATLERLFYPGAEEIMAAASELVGTEIAPFAARTSYPTESIEEEFHGPF